MIGQELSDRMAALGTGLDDEGTRHIAWRYRT